MAKHRVHFRVVTDYSNQETFLINPITNEKLVDCSIKTKWEQCPNNEEENWTSVEVELEFEHGSENPLSIIYNVR